MVDRIKKIIEKEGMTPSVFADQIGISRATINHLLNGRNNPSLDVLTKIIAKCPDMNIEWLMFGSGPMYKGEKAFLQPSLFDEISTESNKLPAPKDYRKEMEVKSLEKQMNETITEQITLQKSIVKNIDKIIIYYSDNTFENFFPENR